MPLITIIGAGPGLGLEIARAFGRKGFDIALVARNQAKLDTLAGTLTDEGFRARGFAADVSRPDTITAALGRDQGRPRADRRAGILPGGSNTRFRGRARGDA
ncbi:SDR family NAD(P)-dependent oxidoreductase [Rhodococcoides fascians]|uniref:SDR family NAD(P)-dependent oxidoreductase n=1 Tax=Rhodococcoides fascians TaxID=1828 RepID=UPI001C52F30C|nr:SDR family NAD(P)-dependent oxidoreductase [Rhodococcus fascians]